MVSKHKRSRTFYQDFGPKADTVEIFLEVARGVALESSAEHPVDIAYAMTNAIENTARTLDIIAHGEFE